MSAPSLLLLISDEGMSVSPSAQGVEIGVEIDQPTTRKTASINGCNFVSVWFDTNILNITIRIDYSLDEGQTWTPLISNVNPLSNNAQITMSRWRGIPQEAKTVATMFRAVAIGVVPATFHFIEIQFRG